MNEQAPRKYPDMWVDPEDDPRETGIETARARRRCWPSTSTTTG